MCMHQFKTRTIYGEPVSVPCGSCVTCRRTQRTFWSHRIQSDVSFMYRQGVGSSFVTLTIDSDLTPKLSKPDLQKFFKRLRKKCPVKFSYLAIGDYGENTQRPHYHALMIGFPSELEYYVRKSWTKGFIDVKPINPGNINYVVRYMQKQTPTFKKKFKDLGLQEPFNVSSRGIGSSLKIVDGKYQYKGKWYNLPPYWQSVHNVHSVPTDMSHYISIARREGYPDVQSYLNHKAWLAEYNATRAAQNRLQPPQGVRHTYFKYDPNLFRPGSHVDVPEDLF